MQLANIVLVRCSKLKGNFSKLWKAVKTATYYSFHQEKANVAALNINASPEKDNVIKL